MAITTIGGTINSTAVTSNLDYKYGPYSSKQEAYNTLGPNGLDKLAIGLTVGIVESGSITEYWFKDGLTLDSLVKKSGGASAYDIAVENGYIGTEQEWLASLKAQFGSFRTLEYNSPEPNLPASSSTTQYIYLMPNSASDPTAQIMWITVDNGSEADPRYIWESLGETDIATFYTGEVVGETKIINNLITGGVHDLLSAEQGKELNELITGINISDLINSLPISDGEDLNDGDVYIDNTTGAIKIKLAAL